jgi:hypothetical protein
MAKPQIAPARLATTTFKTHEEWLPRRMFDLRQLFGPNINWPKPLRKLGETAEDIDIAPVKSGQQ